MSSNNTTFLDVGAGVTTRRIACLCAQGRNDNRPGLLWLSGFNSTMIGAKASELAAWASKRGTAMTRFDYSGHGQSSGTFEDGSISSWLEEAHAVLEVRTVGPQILIGSSMGGWLAVLLAETLNSVTPGRIAGLVLIAPAWDMTERLMWGNAPEEIRQVMRTEGVWHRPSEYSDNNYPITMHLIEDGRRHLLGARSVETGCPVRIIHGLSDPDVPWQGSLELAEKFVTNDVHLALVKAGGHRLSDPAEIALLKRTVAELVDRD